MSVASVGYSVSPMPLSRHPGLPDNVRGSMRQNDASQPKVKPQIRSTTEDLQRLSKALNRRLQFEVDQNSNQVIVKVIDKETDKVIKVLPPEELQRLHRNLKEAIGLLFDEMV